MLSRVSSLARGFAAPVVSTVNVSLIEGIEWFCRGKDGKGTVLTTGAGSAPTPPDSLLMGYGACAASGVKFLLEKRGKVVKSMETEIAGTWDMTPFPRISAIDLHFKVEADDVDQELLDKLVHEVETKMCPVGQTLRHGTVVKHVD